MLNKLYNLELLSLGNYSFSVRYSHSSIYTRNAASTLILHSHLSNTSKPADSLDHLIVILFSDILDLKEFTKLHEIASKTNVKVAYSKVIITK